MFEIYEYLPYIDCVYSLEEPRLCVIIGRTKILCNHWKNQDSVQSLDELRLCVIIVDCM